MGMGALAHPEQARTAERPVVRQGLIEAVRSRQVRLAAVRRASDGLKSHPGRDSPAHLIDLLAGGCESELEIFGVQHVLPTRPAVPPYAQQHRGPAGWPADHAGRCLA